ncbi:MAG TPA: hypothetical protein VN648_19785, partial [Candidatus Methylomirabilis sp.]|nr:hypothetical protein [Candidatus Methylomirabilis sp.]
MSATLIFSEIVVRLDGNMLVEEDAGTMEEVRVQQHLSLPTLCELAFLNPKGPLAVPESRLAGSKLRVEVVGHSDPLFAGDVTAVEYAYLPSGGVKVRVRG